MDLDPGEDQGHQGHYDPHRQPPRDAAGDEAGQDHPIGDGGDQHLLHIAGELARIEGGRHVGIGVGDDRHQDQPGDDEVQISETVHGPDARADEPAEDHEVEGRGDDRGQHRLHPDPRKPPDLLDQDGGEGNPVVPLALHARMSLSPL